MILTRPLIFVTLSFIVVANLQAQVGEKYYGRASYSFDAEKFNRLHNLNRVVDDPEYTKAQRDFDFNTTTGVLNTPINRKDFVNINNRDHFSNDKLFDLPFSTVKDLELLTLRQKKVELQIFSNDKSKYSISSFHKGLKGEFNWEFNRYAPNLIGDKNITKESIMANFFNKNASSKLVAGSYVATDSLKKKQSKSDLFGFPQHKYIRVVKDNEGRYYLDSSITAQPTTKGAYSFDSQANHLNTYESNAQVTKSKLPLLMPKTKITKTAPVMQLRVVGLLPEKENRIITFRQHQYIRIYTDSEGRIRMDTTQKAPVQLTNNNTNQTEKWEEKSKNIKSALSISSKPALSINPTKVEVRKLNRIYKNEFRQHPFIKIYQDKDGKIKFDTTSFERPN